MAWSPVLGNDGLYKKADMSGVITQTSGDARWLLLHGENSIQDADINLFNAGARLGQSSAGKDFAVWRHATWDGATPSDQYVKIGFDGGGSP